MNSYYTKFKVYYKEQIETMLTTFDIDLVAYDETEYFRPYNDA
jgi:hypothetical protein